MECTTYQFQEENGHVVVSDFGGIRTRYTFEMCGACDEWIIWMGMYGSRGGYLRGHYVASCQCILENL